MQEQSCTARALVLAIALTAATFCFTATPVHAAGKSVPQMSDAGTVTETITFRQPRVTGKGFIALKRYAKTIAPSKKNTYQLEHVDIDVYINPKADDFTQTAAANMSNEVARKLVGWGVPRDRISRTTEGKERAETKPGTYDIELKATGRKS